MVSGYTDEDWMVSVDDHLIEPPRVWVDRLPAKYRDLGPRWVDDGKNEAWEFDGKRIAIGGAVTAGAFPLNARPEPFRALKWGEIPPSCYDPKARVGSMDLDRVAAALVFPNLPGFAGNLFQRARDRTLALHCIQAYNDWVLEEWCGPYPDRFIGLALIPMWDPLLAATEAERAIKKGARSIAFSLAPQNLGFPGIHSHKGYWDRLFSVVNEARVPLSSHLGTEIAEEFSVLDIDKLAARLESSGVDLGELGSQVKQGADLELLETVKPDLAEPVAASRPQRLSTHPRVIAIMCQFGAQAPMLEWLFSGNFERFPNLKVVLSENGIGWMPAILACADWMVEMSRSRVSQPHDAENNPLFTETARKLAASTMEARAHRDRNARLPSEIFRDHIYGCFINDAAGVKMLDVIGVDNVMIETDFPHNATWFPHSMQKAKESLAHLPEAAWRKIVRGNAERIFRFTARAPASIAA